MSPASEVDPEAERFTPAPPGFTLFLAQPPRPDWVRVLELNAEEHLKTFSQPLVYRALKLLHGVSDVITLLVSDDHKSAHGLDWSYTLTAGEDVLCEVRSKHFSRVHLEFWTPAEGTSRDRLVEVAFTLCAALSEFLEQNGHIWEEATDLPADEAMSGIANVAAEKLHGAERLLAAAVMLDERPLARPIAPGEPVDVPAVGYLYSSAALQFFVALEAFVNLLYVVLLRPEFRTRIYERLAARFEIDLRLASMQVFCDGFASQPIAPGSDLWERVIQLRDFRNDLVHGNITEEHRVYSFVDDSFLFFYSPASDFRGRKLEAKAERGLPRAQTQITRRTVESVQATVNEVRSALIAAMDAETMSWVQSWLSSPAVPPRHAKKGN
jgi:hypothetical protein